MTGTLLARGTWQRWHGNGERSSPRRCQHHRCDTLVKKPHRRELLSDTFVYLFQVLLCQEASNVLLISCYGCYYNIMT